MLQLMRSMKCSLFKNKLNRQLLKSMLHEVVIASDVVYAWSINLNDNEASRTSLTPKRFFATTRIFKDIFLSRPKSLQGDAIMFQFVERLTTEVQKYSHHPVGYINMVFEKSNFLEKKYGRVLRDMKEIFNFFLIEQHLKPKVEALSKSKYDILHLDWGDQKNKKDGVVFTMRHMETFMGEPTKNWRG